MSNTTIGEVISVWLINNGYDGLYNPDLCACEAGDLFPCGSPDMSNCKPGYIGKCDPKTCTLDGDCEWHIVSEKG